MTTTSSRVYRGKRFWIFDAYVSLSWSPSLLLAYYLALSIWGHCLSILLVRSVSNNVFHVTSKRVSYEEWYQRSFHHFASTFFFFFILNTRTINCLLKVKFFGIPYPEIFEFLSISYLDFFRHLFFIYLTFSIFVL